MDAFGKNSEEKSQNTNFKSQISKIIIQKPVSRFQHPETSFKFIFITLFCFSKLSKEWKKK